MLGFMDLKWPRVARRSNVGLVLICRRLDAMNSNVLFMESTEYIYIYTYIYINIYIYL